jgi:GWxTD domain-containing protein
VLDAGGNLFRGGTAVIAESIDIKGWPTGRYDLRITAQDPEVDKSDTVSVPFQIISPQEVQLALKRATSKDPYDRLSRGEKVQLVTYLLTPEQKATLDRLTDTGKLNFLDQYWREHDENPATEVIENRLELISRYAFCNYRFSNNENRTDGWATDRGRIYMTYGQWDEIDDRQAVILGNPYQIWHYRGIKEGKVFVFEDWTGTEEYRLVHSNVYGEIFSREWQDRLDQGLSDLPIEH